MYFHQSPDTFGTTHSSKGANHNRIALNKFFSESFPNFWQVSAREMGIAIYYHQVEPETITWRYVLQKEQWIWVEGGPVTVS